MASVYLLYHYDAIYAVVDSAWTAAKLLVEKRQIDEDLTLVTYPSYHAGEYKTLGELMRAWLREGQTIGVISDLLEGISSWSLMEWRLVEQTLWTVEDCEKLEGTLN